MNLLADLKQSKASFTLVELILVVTIIAIMAGAVIPNFSGYLNTVTIKNAAETLAQIFRYARSLAIEQSAVSKVVIDSETRQISLLIEVDPFNSPGQFAPAKLPISYPKEFRAKIAIANIVRMGIPTAAQPAAAIQQPQAQAQTPATAPLQQELSFQPSGTTSDTLIYLVDQNEQMYTIGIVGLTGQVMVWNHAVESFYEP